MDSREASSHDDQRIQGILAYFDDNIAKYKGPNFLHNLLVSDDILTYGIFVDKLCISPKPYQTEISSANWSIACLQMTWTFLNHLVSMLL